MKLMSKLRKMRAIDESVEEIDFSPLEKKGISYETDGKNVKVYASHNDFMEAMGRDADSCVDYQITFDECRDSKIDEGVEIKKERMTGIQKIEITGDLLFKFHIYRGDMSNKGPFIFDNLNGVAPFEVELYDTHALANPIIPDGVDVDDYVASTKYLRQLKALKTALSKNEKLVYKTDMNDIELDDLRRKLGMGKKDTSTGRVNKYTNKSDEWMKSLDVKRKPFAELEGKNLSNKQIISMMRKIGAEPVKGKSGTYSWLNESDGSGYDVLFLSLYDNDGDGKLELAIDKAYGEEVKPTVKVLKAIEKELIADIKKAEI